MCLQGRNWSRKESSWTKLADLKVQGQTRSFSKSSWTNSPVLPETFNSSGVRPLFLVDPLPYLCSAPLHKMDQHRPPAHAPFTGHKDRWTCQFFTPLRHAGNRSCCGRRASTRSAAPTRSSSAYAASCVTQPPRSSASPWSVSTGRASTNSHSTTRGVAATCPSLRPRCASSCGNC